MLDLTRRYEANHSEALGDYPLIQVAALRGTLLRCWRCIPAVLVLIVGSSYLILTLPQYTAAALILIDFKNPPCCEMLQHVKTQVSLQLAPGARSRNPDRSGPRGRWFRPRNS